MTVTLSQIHKVLQTYGKQVKKGARLKAQAKEESAPLVGRVRLSAEAKRKVVIERVATEIIARMAQGDVQPGSVESQVMDELSAEFGEQLALGLDQATGKFSFRVVDREHGRVARYLEEAESEVLTQRMIDQTKEKVDKNMF